MDIAANSTGPTSKSSIVAGVVNVSVNGVGFNISKEQENLVHLDDIIIFEIVSDDPILVKLRGSNKKWK